MIFSFFKTPKHQQFNYSPRYYNAEEEERRERLKRARGEAVTEGGPVKRVQFRRHSAGYEEAARKSNRNVIFLIFIITAMVLLIFSDYISLRTAVLALGLLVVWRTGLISSWRRSLLERINRRKA
ncbi:MAG: hypothetical protein ACK417_02930 [Bacteroidia bacterium]